MCLVQINVYPTIHYSSIIPYLFSISCDILILLPIERHLDVDSEENSSQNDGTLKRSISSFASHTSEAVKKG